MEHFVPSPSNTSLLRLQDSHVSKYVWNGEEITFRARCNFWQSLPNEQVLQLIRNTAFGPMLDIGVVEINNHLLTAMRHTFHLPNGECTITLQDVAYQLGLPIDGKPITGDTSLDWVDLCVQLLGVAPTDRQIMGQRVQHTWLESIYQELPEDADEEVNDRRIPHAGYIRVPIKEQKEVGGCLLLLQSWAYDHIPILAPRLHDTTLQFFPLVKRWSQHLITTNIPGHAVNIIRAMLDRLRVNQFVWTPYTTMNIMGSISDICRASVPLICFAIVEWHASNRVMRQFGLQQTIPQDPSNFDKLHKMDLRGKNEYNWPKKHEVWIKMWESREQCVVNGVPDNETLYHHSQYMQWYLQRTRRYISPDEAYSLGAFKFASELMERTAGLQCYNNPIQTIDYVHQACKELVKALAELNPVAFSISQPQAPPSQNFAMPTYDSKLQHQISSQTHFQPQMRSPHVYGEQPYGSFTAYPTNYHMGQSSQYQ
ncbi:hypothetical protein Lal_00021004 [Lupinus albus]|nr:hypothetical protein Lal_00021004 [Lupinus albus]